MPYREERKITAEYIKHVQNMIEDCIQKYLNRKDTVNILVQQANIDPDVTKLVWQKLKEQNEDFFKAYRVRLLVKEQILMFNHLLKQQVDTIKRVDAMKNVAHAPEFTSVPCYSGFRLPTGSSRHENMFVRPGAANTNAVKNSAPFRTQYVQQYNHGVNEYNHGVGGGESNANVMISTPFHNQSEHYNHGIVFGKELQPDVIINSTPFLNHGSAQNNHGVSGEESNNNIFITNIPFGNQGIQRPNRGASGELNANVMISNTSLGKQPIQQSNNSIRGEKWITNNMIKSTAFGNQGIQHINHSSSGGEPNADMLIQSAPFGNQGFHRTYNGYSEGELNADVMIKNTDFGNQGNKQIGITDRSNDSTMMNSTSTGNQGTQHFNFGINGTLGNTGSLLEPHGVLPDVVFNSSDFGDSSRSCSDNFEDYGRPTFFQSDSNGFWDFDSET